MYKKPETLESVEDISLFVDYNNGTIKTRTNFTLDNGKTTVYHLLVNCCETSVQNFGGFIYVNEINGIGPGWIYTINEGTPPNLPADYYNLLDNDTVKWKHVN